MMYSHVASVMAENINPSKEINMETMPQHLQCMVGVTLIMLTHPISLQIFFLTEPLQHCRTDTVIKIHSSTAASSSHSLQIKMSQSPEPPRA